ncbi:MAG: biopolymer transporter ExbD, partial [Planctomycetales bacterium]|nr:biopolymer transporter ExbD [Planctomycetales bacterium]
FQLLIFFIMSFKIVTMEGDFNIRMPASAPNPGPPSTESLIPPMKLKLSADRSSGNLTSIRLNNELEFNSFDELHRHVLSMIGGDSGPGAGDAEIELDCDYNLKYEYVIAAITAVSGERTADDQIIRLIEKIKFTPPQE